MPNPSELERQRLRVGSLVYSTDQGLGVLAKAFFDNGVVTDAMVIRHGRRPENDHWFPNQPRCGDVRRVRQLEEFCSHMDVMLFFETPFAWELLPFCRRKGVKTVIMPMHECTPRELPALPDLWLCPSLLDLYTFSRKAGHGVEASYLPVPVEVPWKQRTTAKVFVHNAGWGGLNGRNGTRELVQALPYVTKEGVELVIRTQEKLDVPLRNLGTKVLVRQEIGTTPYERLFSEGDVFIFPERFNGLSLPLQEARASGMLVMATNRFPMNTWLPREPLIPTRGKRTSCVAQRCLEYAEAVVEPRDIATTIDSWYERDITEYSQGGKAWAEANSWAVWKPQYMSRLERLVYGT